jgi:hypothetical protein
MAFGDRDAAFEDPVLLPVLQTGGRGRYRPALTPDDVLLGGTFRHQANVREGTYTIFEGTSEIQWLIISRAISGRHIH